MELDTRIELARLLRQVADLIDEPPYVHHLDNTRTHPTYHYRYAKDLAPGATVETYPGRWEEVVEIRPTQDPFANGLDVLFADGSGQTVSEFSSVHVRHGGA